MAISRRQLLRADVADRMRPLFPPWSGVAFTERCDRCGACIEACHSTILVIGDGGYPVVDFRRGECDFCGECLTHCHSGALQQGSPSSPPWQLHPSISETCLAMNGVVCRSCGEQCEQRAIRFRPGPSGVSRPETLAELCTGCGACVRPCPVGAISVRESALTSTEHPLQQEKRA